MAMVHPLSMAFHGYPDRRDAWLGSAASAEGMAEPIWHSSRGGELRTPRGRAAC